MLETLPLLALFCLSTSATPGPNNIMLTASGANYGVKRSLPHLFGIVLGFPMMVMALGLGLAAVFHAVPIIHEVLRYAGAAYLCWLGFRIATARRAADGRSTGRPFSFLEAAAFQWINPKAWVMGVGAIAAFTTAGEDFTGTAVGEVVVIAATYVVSGLIGCGLWLCFGAAIGRVLRHPGAFRAFNLTLGGVTIASVVLLFV